MYVFIGGAVILALFLVYSFASSELLHQIFYPPLVQILSLANETHTFMISNPVY